MSKLTKEQMREMTRDFVRGAIKSHSQKMLTESMEELPPPGAGRKSGVSTDATILVDDYIQGAVFDGLEEMGLTAEQASEIIRQLHNRPDVVIAACVNGLYDYKEKLGMTGKPKPRSI